MPLFNYECENCNIIIEKFQRGEDSPDIICPECQGNDFKKLLSVSKNRVWLNSRDFYNQKIAPDAKRIMKKMGKKDNHFLDVYGEK